MRYFCVLFAALVVLNVYSTSKVLTKRNTQKNRLGLNKSNTKNSTTTSQNHACDFGNTPKPNFNAPGRRISTAKCLEYIWQRNYRDIKNKKMRECEKSQGKYPVLGGRNALPGEFPHMGGVGWKAREGTWIFKCGCTLISSKFTLTAAHCSKSPPDTRLKSSVPSIVRLGDKNIIDAYSGGFYPKDSNILKIIVHPNYHSPTKYYDIALLEIFELWEFTKNLQPACLWSEFDTAKLGTSATVTGWGAVDAATKKTSPKLQAAVVDIIDSKQCNALLQYSHNRHWCGVEDHQLCGGKLSGGIDSCEGDSGGPLQVKIALPENGEGSMHFIIGVTSFGIGCGLPDQPGVYTRVSSFIDWIESIVWKVK